jgi:Kef-type K+ transport system membrane component KefB
VSGSAVPFYLVAGLAVGEGGVLPLETSRGFVQTGASIGLILLLFMLGLEYSASRAHRGRPRGAAVGRRRPRQRRPGLRGRAPAGVGSRAGVPARRDVLFFEGLAVSPSGLPPTLPAALVLAAAGALTKFGTGWWAGRRAGLERDDAIGAGNLLITRGEFSVAIAALGAAVEPKLTPLAVSYVIVLAIVVPVAYRLFRPRSNGSRSRITPD